jgi:hypothetical protein
VPIIGEPDPAARRTSSYPGQRGGRRYRPKSRERSALKQRFSWQVSCERPDPHHCLSSPPMVRVQRVLPSRCDAEHSHAGTVRSTRWSGVARGPNKRENTAPQPARHRGRRQAIDRRGSSLTVIRNALRPSTPRGEALAASAGNLVSRRLVRRGHGAVKAQLRRGLRTVSPAAQPAATPLPRSSFQRTSGPTRPGQR